MRKSSFIPLALGAVSFLLTLSLPIFPSTMADDASARSSDAPKDRIPWEVSISSGDTQMHAEFWAGRRSLPLPSECLESPDSMNGCDTVKARLTGPDVLRKLLPDYRQASDSYVAGVTPSPSHTQGSAGPPPTQSPQSGWWIVMGTFSVRDNAFRAVDDAAGRCGLRVFHDLSNKFTSFTPGYTIVVTGPFGTRDDGERMLNVTRACVPDAFLKYAEYSGTYVEQEGRPLAAAEARRHLEKQAAKDELDRKLRERGFQLLSPVDINLDWKSFMTSNTKVAIRGTYIQAHDSEWLSTPDNKDQPTIRLYTNDASRDARKLMLECRNSDFKYSLCEMIVGATIRNCVRNKGELNEKQVPCLDVQQAFLVP